MDDGSIRLLGIRQPSRHLSIAAVAISNWAVRLVAPMLKLASIAT
jgi:hypothetical protein